MEMVKVVGANLRSARAHRGLSLSEVARRAGIGKGTLSELEAGQRNPTLETLYALATVLDVPLGQLLSTDDDAPSQTDLVVRRASEAELSGQAVDVQLVDRTVSAGQALEIYRIQVRAGHRYVSPAHRPRVIEQLLVHSGTLLAGPESDPATLDPGDYIRFDGGSDHVYAALDDDVTGTLVMRYIGTEPDETAHHPHNSEKNPEP